MFISRVNVCIIYNIYVIRKIVLFICVNPWNILSPTRDRIIFSEQAEEKTKLISGFTHIVTYRQ